MNVQLPFLFPRGPMRFSATPLLALALGACASTAGTGSAPPPPTTTTISMAGTGGGGSLGSGTVGVRSTADAGMTRTELAAPPERVFAALREVYPAIGVEVGTVDDAQRIVGNRRLEISRRLGSSPISRYLRCGETAFGAPAADQHRVRVNMISTVRAAGEGSVVETVLQATATPVGQNTVSTCQTTGVLEENLAKALQLRLATGS